jgi:hypothetical protein
MKVVALIWVIVSAVFAALATILNLEPATTFIDVFASRDGSYFIAIPFGLTWIICLVPLIFVMLINNLIQNRKNKIPVDLTGKTGIIIQREKELQNAALQYGILINGKVEKKVGMGRKVFIELIPGTYTVQIKLGKWKSAVLNADLASGKIVAYSTKADFNKSLTTIIPTGEMLFLVQIPYH